MTSSSLETKPATGVIGTGAMGMGVVESLLRHGFPTHARDIRDDAMRRATRLGAICHASAAALALACDIVVVLVVDAAQADDVLFGAGGVTRAAPHAPVVVLSSTVAPDDASALSLRLAAHGVALVDAPVSGGPGRAADGSMTIMVAGDAAARTRCEPVFAAVAGRVFNLGDVPGDASKFKIVNNMLAAANLAAGAEALALASKAGLDLKRLVDVVNASSGGSWIFADRMPRALAGDFAPRAAGRILAKDVGIAVEFAARLGVDATFANAASDAFQRMVDAGYGDEDDAAMVKFMREMSNR